jgi:hypothetical protein
VNFKVNQTYWEESIKEYFSNQKSEYIEKIKKTIVLYGDTSPEMIRILIEMKRACGK